MYPYLRLIWIVASAKYRKPLAFGEPGVIRLTAWPWDCDIYPEINNGRQLTLFDLGRFDQGARSGFFKILAKKKWGVVVGGSSMQYRSRIRPFQRFTLRTDAVARDDKWFYFVQTTFVRDKPCSQALVRAAVFSGPRGTVPTQEVMEALGRPEWRPEIPNWVEAWSDAEKKRPWPPTSLEQIET